jgi:hypothetical protein
LSHWLRNEALWASVSSSIKWGNSNTCLILGAVGIQLHSDGKSL